MTQATSTLTRADLIGVGDAGPAQGVATEQAEPHLDLVEPRGVGRDEVQRDIGVAT